MHVPVRPQPPDARAGDDPDRLRARLLDDLEQWPQLAEEAAQEHLPRTEVEETADAWLVDVDLPGVPPADASVDVVRGRLVVTGRRRSRTGRVDGRTGARGDVRLELTLPVGVDLARIEASLDLGVLQVRLPKAPSAGPRRIPVRTRQA